MLDTSPRTQPTPRFAQGYTIYHGVGRPVTRASWRLVNFLHFKEKSNKMAGDIQTILLAPEAESIIEHFEVFDVKDIGSQRYEIYS